MTTKKVKLAKMIEINMRKKNLTMKELGAMVGKTESAVSHWISGHAVPRIETVQQLANIFGLTTDEMLYGVGNNKASQIVNGIDLNKENIAFFSKDIEDLTEEELKEVAEFIKFVKSKRN